MSFPTFDVRQRLDRGPVRLRRNGRQSRAVGLYFSVKTGRHLPFESTLELHDLWRAEVDSVVVRSFVQPFTLQLAVGGERWRYTPDRCDLLADGSERIVEVKDDGWAQLSPALAGRLDHAFRELERAGTPLHIHTRLQIQAEPTFSAISEILRHRRTAVPLEQRVMVADRLERGPADLGELQRLLGGGPCAWAVLCALMVRRVLTIDFDAGLHDRAPVRPVD